MFCFFVIWTAWRDDSKNSIRDVAQSYMRRRRGFKTSMPHEENLVQVEGVYEEASKPQLSSHSFQEPQLPKCSTSVMPGCEHGPRKKYLSYAQSQRATIRIGAPSPISFLEQRSGLPTRPYHCWHAGCVEEHKLRWEKERKLQTSWVESLSGPKINRQWQWKRKRTRNELPSIEPELR